MGERSRATHHQQLRAATAHHFYSLGRAWDHASLSPPRLTLHLPPLPPPPLPQGLPLDLTAEQAAGPGCAALVADMCGLFEELKRLSRLEQGGELEVSGSEWLSLSGSCLVRCVSKPARDVHVVLTWHCTTLLPNSPMQDVPTRWFAANFMAQAHPLVVAMRSQVGQAGGRQGFGCQQPLLFAWRVHCSTATYK